MDEKDSSLNSKTTTSLFGTNVPNILTPPQNRRSIVEVTEEYLARTRK